ncbi:Biopterin transport-related protein BT1 [Corchorus olitorius]|uniref:Biopterin transport-related protein BT1 n=1 Tax=Corchorus olitorius TaxID=93759 RepID=A0A1R3HU52_9ROSI|nr:Biopterin transport-related protein BT1 [Corchorus olitorius]
MEEEREENETKQRLLYEDSAENHTRRNHPRKGILEMILRPIKWLKMLSEELHWSFVVGVVIVHGINQGFSVGLRIVSTQYYMKDVQKVQPSQAQVLIGLIYFPVIVKPLWGLLSDFVPFCGYRRRPYFVFAVCLLREKGREGKRNVERNIWPFCCGKKVNRILSGSCGNVALLKMVHIGCLFCCDLKGFLGMISMLVLSLYKNLHLAFAMFCLVAGTAGISIADVAIDAIVTQNTLSHPSLAGDMQSLCGLCASIGQLLGFSLSGFFVHLAGAEGVFGFLSIPASLVVLVGFFLKESQVRNLAYKRVKEKFVDASKAMWRTLKHRDVWRPCLYMFLSHALGLHLHEGMFYWYTNAKEGPSFSQEVVGSIFSFGAVGSLLGVLLYQNLLKNHPFRDMLFWAQLLYGLSGLLDLVLVLRINLKLGMPDYLFVVIDETITRMIGRIKWMPFLVLSSKLCPPGIEGTFFAILMSIDHIGLLSSAWSGGLVLHVLNVTRTQFDNLWIALLIRSLLRLIPIGFLFLIPRSDPHLSIVPSDISRTKKGNDLLEPENMEMASLVDNS